MNTFPVFNLSKTRGFFIFYKQNMKKAKSREEILAKIQDLKKQIDSIGTQIERDRKENDADDSAVLHELLDKKDYLEQSIDTLLDSLKNTELPKTFGQQYKVSINGSTREFKVVHPTQVDTQNGYISTESPIALALDGNRAGDYVELDTPAGKQVIEILEVSAV